MENLEYYENIHFFKIFLKSIIISIFCSLFFIFILSILVSNTNIAEKIIQPSVIFISAISILIGGFFVSKKIRKKGIICGTLVGVMYMVIMYFISSFMNMNFSLDGNSFIMIGLGLLGGAIGGILGVNL